MQRWRVSAAKAEKVGRLPRAQECFLAPPLLDAAVLPGCIAGFLEWQQTAVPQYLLERRSVSLIG
jgi:hypothetical protein